MYIDYSPFHIIDIVEIGKKIKDFSNKYIEVIIEDSISTRIRYRNGSVEDISKGMNCGGNIRAFLDGKMGFVSFNDVENCSEYIKRAIRNAALLNASFVRKKINEELVTYEENKEFMNIDINSVIETIDSISKRFHRENVVNSTFVSFGSSIKEKKYYNSNGSSIIQKNCDIVLTFSLITECNGIISPIDRKSVV